MNKNIIKKFGAGLLASATMFMGSAFMVGCSEDGNVLGDGGVAEETSIALKGSVQIASRISGLNSDSLNLSGMVPYEIRNVRFCELDSVSFEKNAECFETEVSNGAEYKLKIKGPGWRYGLLTVSGDWGDDDVVSYHAVVDSKDSSEVNVNALTSWKYHLVKGMVKSGERVADALVRAEDEILDSLGVFGEYESFEKMSLLGTTKSDALLVAATYLLNDVSSEYDNVREVAMNMASRELVRNLIRNPMFWKMMGASEPKDDFKDLVEKIVANFTSVYFDLGRCDSKNEGRNLNTENFDFGSLSENMQWFGLGLSCHDGFWSWYEPEIEHVVGSMSDSRDGRVYKTTSIKVNGKTQTWMAEDLKYELPGSSCLDESLNTCEKFGRIYTWADALQLDTADFWGFDSTLMAEDEDVKHCVDDLLSHYEEWAYENGELKYDSLVAYKECGAWGIRYKEVLEAVDIQNHQGVCPDGWRIPSAKDWMLLAEVVGDGHPMGLMLMKKDSWVFSSIRTEVGRAQIFLRTIDAIEFSAVPNTHNELSGRYASIPSFEDEDEHRGSEGNFVFLQSAVNDFVGIYREYYDYEPVMMGIRCIKAD